MSFKVGDIVRVKSWDRMVSEYGYVKGDYSLDEETINIPYHFTKLMKPCCENDYEIASGTCGDNGPIRLVGLRWSFSIGMFEEINPLEDAIKSIRQEIDLQGSS